MWWWSGSHDETFIRVWETKNRIKQKKKKISNLFLRNVTSVLSKENSLMTFVFFRKFFEDGYI